MSAAAPSKLQRLLLAIVSYLLVIVNIANSPDGFNSFHFGEREKITRPVSN